MRTPLLRHLETEDLVRFVDHALEPDERATFEAHLATCADCGDRSRLIQDWTGSLHSVLESTDASVALPDRLVIPRRGGWRAAAAILLIASAGLAVPPLRAWIIEAGGRVWSSLQHLASSETPATVTATAPRLLVRPDGPEFAIILPAGVVSGTLTVEVIAGDSLSVTPSGVSAPSRLVMLPGAVQLGGGGDYLVRVPLTVHRLLVRRSESVVRTLRPLTPGERWIVPLQSETAH